MEVSALEIFIQVIGYIGLTFSIIAFQCKVHKNVMIFKTSNEMVFALQYILLGAYTGAAMNLISSLRNLIFARLICKGKSTLPYQIIFSISFIFFGILTWQGPLSFMIIAAKVITTIAYGIRRTDILRLLTLPTSVCWLIYNASCMSTAGVICEAFTICSIITAIIRIDILGRKKKVK